MFVELDEADFCVPEDGHPDEIMLPISINGPVVNERPQVNAPLAQVQQDARPPARSNSGPYNNNAPQTPNQNHSRPAPSHGGQMAGGNRPQPPAANRGPPNNQPGPSRPPSVPPVSNAPESVGFFSARAVVQLPEASLQGTNNAPIGAPRAQEAFNPKAESPSIRKTPGIDHSSSKPLARNGQHVPPAPSQSSLAPQANTNGFTPVKPSFSSSQAARGNVVNPSIDQTRRIGAPGGPSSPLANRGSYRPPTMKRPPPAEGGVGRPPLADLPANGNGTAGGAAPVNGLEAKRQKMA